jgi:hypothetical protein
LGVCQTELASTNAPSSWYPLWHTVVDEPLDEHHPSLISGFTLVAIL